MEKVTTEKKETSLANEPKQTAEETKPNNEGLLKDQVAQQNSIMQQMQKQIEILTKAADVNRLDRATPKESDGSIVVRVSTYQKTPDEPAKLITSWRTLQNEVICNEKTGIEEHQTYEITLEDDSKVVLGKQLGYKEFVNSIVKKPVRIQPEKIDYITKRVDGVTKIEGIKSVIVDWNQKQFTIFSNFIN